jgi:hypothetical protein
MTFDRAFYFIKFVRFSFVILFCAHGFSQSITNPFKTLKENKEIVFGLDNRRIQIYQHHTVIYGLYSGVSFGKMLRFKMGINGTPFEVGKFIDNNGLVKRNRLLFLSIGEEFDFYRYKKFVMTTYLQVGIGKNLFRQLNSNGIELNKAEELIVPVEAGLHFSYDLLPFLGLKTGFGWRYVAPKESSNLSGYYLKLGLSFNLQKFLEMRKKNKAMSDKPIGTDK